MSSIQSKISRHVKKQKKKSVLRKQNWSRLTQMMELTDKEIKRI